MNEGIVLRKTDYKETSYILNLITENGFLSLFNNGVKKKNSNKLAISEPITLISFINSEGKYKTLIEGYVIDEFKKIKSDLLKLSVANVMVEYILSLFEASLDAFKLYNLLKSSLEELDNSKDDFEITLFRFELILLSYIGISPRKEYLIETYGASSSLIDSLMNIMKDSKEINKEELRDFFEKYYEREGGIVLKSKKLYHSLVG